MNPSCRDLELLVSLRTLERLFSGRSSRALDRPWPLRVPPRTRTSIDATNKFRYMKNRVKPSSCSMCSVEYRWMRKPTKVTKRTITDDSGNQTTVILERFQPGASVDGINFDIDAEARKRRG